MPTCLPSEQSTTAELLLHWHSTCQRNFIRSNVEIHRTLFQNSAAADLDPRLAYLVKRICKRDVWAFNFFVFSVFDGIVGSSSTNLSIPVFSLWIILQQKVVGSCTLKNIGVPAFTCEYSWSNVASISRATSSGKRFKHRWFCMWFDYFVNRWWLYEVWHAPETSVKMLYNYNPFSFKNNKNFSSSWKKLSVVCFPERPQNGKEGQNRDWLLVDGSCQEPISTRSSKTENSPCSFFKVAGGSFGSDEMCQFFCQHLPSMAQAFRKWIDLMPDKRAGSWRGMWPGRDVVAYAKSVLSIDAVLRHFYFPFSQHSRLLSSKKKRELATQFSFLCMSTTVSGSNSLSFAIIGDQSLEIWQRALRMTGDTDTAKSSKLFFPSFFFCLLPNIS